MKKFASLFMFVIFFGFIMMGAYACSSDSSANASVTDATGELPATCDTCDSGSGGTIRVAVEEIPGQNSRLVIIDYLFLGFPSWRDETMAAAYSDPLLILTNKIVSIKTEIISPDKMEVGTPISFCVQGGNLKFHYSFFADPGDFIQLLATTWSGLEYELAFDDPQICPGIDQIYSLIGCGIAQLPDGTWGILIE